MPRCWSVNAPQVIHQTVGTETIIIDLGRGVYFSLADTGSAIWLELAKGRTVEEIARQFDAPTGHQAEIAAAIDKLATELEAERLIVPASSRPPGDEPGAVPALGPYAPANLVKYTDLTDLLLLDPIHDVSEAGWPHVPASLNAPA